MALLLSLPIPYFFSLRRNIRCSSSAAAAAYDDDADLTTLSNFGSRHNHIRVVDVSRQSTDASLAGARLLLLDNPGNIHSIHFPLTSRSDYPFTSSYYDIFAVLPPLLPPGGPLAVLGFGAGTATRILLELYPNLCIHGYEIDGGVVAVARDFFGLADIEQDHGDRFFLHVGDAFDAGVDGGFSGAVVDLFLKGSVVPELQEVEGWRKVKAMLKPGGRVMVNCGGKCVEPEDSALDSEATMAATLQALSVAFDGNVSVMNLGGCYGNDICLALTGVMLDAGLWKAALPAAANSALHCYVDMWRPYSPH